MKYLVAVEFRSVAHVEVNAVTEDEASKLVESCFGVVLREASVSVNNEVITDWNLPMHPVKKIEWVRHCPQQQ